MDLDNGQQAPMYQKLHELRARISDPTTIGEKMPTVTEVEGTIEDMWEMGDVERISDGSYRLSSTETLLQVFDDVSWWALTTKAAIEDRLKGMEQ
jgi:hypothetical protein